MSYLDTAPTYPRHFFNPAAIADDWNGLPHGHLTPKLRKYVGELRENAINMLLTYPNPQCRVVALFNVHFDRLPIMHGYGEIPPDDLPCLKQAGRLGLRSRAAMAKLHLRALRYRVLQRHPLFQWCLDDDARTAC
jgi:hypothetical protein